VLSSDGKREQWDVSGPHLAGWEIYHVKGSPADPGRLYASQSSGWPGQVIRRSDDGGKSWEPVATSSPTTECLAFTRGTTARRTPGSSPGSDTWNRRWMTRTRFMPRSLPLARSGPTTRGDLAAGQPRATIGGHPGPRRRGRPLCAPHRDAPLTPGRAVSAEADASGPRAGCPSSRGSSAVAVTPPIMIRSHLAPELGQLGVAVSGLSCS
jgi:hypothetical protein